MAEDCNKDMYNLVCKERFDDTKKLLECIKTTEESYHQEIIDILRGKNGNPGLIDNVRDNTKLRKFANWIAITFVGAFIIQSVALLFFFIKSMWER